MTNKLYFANMIHNVSCNVMSHELQMLHEKYIKLYLCIFS